VRFAFWSCQDYTHGYYNAHEAMAREDLDFVICLGDFIYDETYHGQGRHGCARRQGRPPQQASSRPASTTCGPPRRSTSTAKYSLYRSDGAAQGQARFPP
jgi:alkaline phosphatase D